MASPKPGNRRERRNAAAALASDIMRSRSGVAQSALHKFFANPIVQGVGAVIALAVALSGKLDHDGTVVCIVVAGIIGAIGIWGNSHQKQKLAAIGVICVYWVLLGGLGHYLTRVPEQKRVGVHDAFYATHFHNADVYIAVNFMNYSKTDEVKVHVEASAYAAGKLLPSNNEDMSYFYTIAPGKLHGVHLPVEFNVDGVADAFRKDQITVLVTVTYNTGTRETKYVFEGRVVSESQSNCVPLNFGIMTCKGVVDSLRSEWD
jgi:hypothetical protein